MEKKTTTDVAGSQRRRLNRVGWENGHYRQSKEFGLEEVIIIDFTCFGMACSNVNGIESMVTVKVRNYLTILVSCTATLI